MVQDWSTCLFPRSNFGDAVAWGQNLPMPLHGPNSALFFSGVELVYICMHSTFKKTHFHRTISPLGADPPLSPPPHPRAPPPSNHLPLGVRRVMHVSQRVGGGAMAMQRRGGKGHDGDDDNDDNNNAAVAADGEDDERLCR